MSLSISSQTSKSDEASHSPTAAMAVHSSPSNSNQNQSEVGSESIRNDPRLNDRARNVAEGLVKTLKLTLNDYSLGWSKVSAHLHRKVPQIVYDARQLHEVALRVDTANTDMADARRAVADLERIEAFCNIGNMIQRSIDITKKEEHSHRHTQSFPGRKK